MNSKLLNEFSEIERLVCLKIREGLMSRHEESLNFDGLQDAVHIKAGNRKILLANSRFQKFFTFREHFNGSHETCIPIESIVETLKLSDDLIFGGCERVWFDHTMEGADGIRYRVQAYKRCLLGYNLGKYRLLGIDRLFPIRTNSVEASNLDSKFNTYSRFSDDLKLLCKLYSSGRTLNEIASELDVSTRTIDNWRRDIVDQLNLKRPFDLIRLMIIFEDRGLMGSVT